MYETLQYITTVLEIQNYFIKTHEFAKKSIRNTLINTLNNSPDRILDKVHTYSQWGFTNYAKNDLINEYTLTCLLTDCYICQQS